jgi:hypothetical protein
VKETLPPLARFMWLFITMRLSMRSFAGMVRTLVAVGTVRLVAMFAARLLDMPRSGVTTSFASGASPVGMTACGLVIGASAGTGTGLAATDVVRAVGWLPITAMGAVIGCAGAAAGAAGASATATGASAAGAASVAGAGDPAVAVWW